MNDFTVQVVSGADFDGGERIEDIEFGDDGSIQPVPLGHKTSSDRIKPSTAALFARRCAKFVAAIPHLHPDSIEKTRWHWATANAREIGFIYAHHAINRARWK